jgi:hypothetical protein
MGPCSRERVNELKMPRLGLLALAVGLAGAPAMAVDVPIGGLKLIVVDKGAAAGAAKMVFVAKDAAITKGTATDKAYVAALLNVAHDGSYGASVMPGGAHWLANTEAVAKYVDKTAPATGSTKIGVIKPGNLIKVVTKSLGDTPFDIGAAPTGPVYAAFTVINGAETFRHCTQFVDCSHKEVAAGAGRKLVCRGNSSGDPSCSAISPATNQSPLVLPPGQFFGPAGGVFTNGDDGSELTVPAGAFDVGASLSVMEVPTAYAQRHIASLGLGVPGDTLVAAVQVGHGTADPHPNLPIQVSIPEPPGVPVDAVLQLTIIEPTNVTGYSDARGPRARVGGAVARAGGRLKFQATPGDFGSPTGMMVITYTTEAQDCDAVCPYSGQVEVPCEFSPPDWPVSYAAMSIEFEAGSLCTSWHCEGTACVQFRPFRHCPLLTPIYIDTDGMARYSANISFDGTVTGVWHELERVKSVSFSALPICQGGPYECSGQLTELPKITVSENDLEGTNVCGPRCSMLFDAGQVNDCSQYISPIDSASGAFPISIDAGSYEFSFQYPEDGSFITGRATIDITGSGGSDGRVGGSVTWESLGPNWCILPADGPLWSGQAYAAGGSPYIALTLPISWPDVPEVRCAALGPIPYVAGGCSVGQVGFGFLGIASWSLCPVSSVTTSTSPTTTVMTTTTTSTLPSCGTYFPSCPPPSVDLTGNYTISWEANGIHLASALLSLTQSGTGLEGSVQWQDVAECAPGKAAFGGIDGPMLVAKACVDTSVIPEDVWLDYGLLADQLDGYCTNGQPGLICFQPGPARIDPNGCLSTPIPNLGWQVTVCRS